MKPKYRIHSDYIISRTDGDKHFISEQRLVQLYGLRPIECVGTVGNSYKGFKDLVDLYPRYDGDYSFAVLLLEKQKYIKDLEALLDNYKNESPLMFFKRWISRTIDNLHRIDK